jgi:hypothetical protein
MGTLLLHCGFSLGFVPVVTFESLALRSRANEHSRRIGPQLERTFWELVIGIVSEARCRFIS